MKDENEVETETLRVWACWDCGRMTIGPRLRCCEDVPGRCFQIPTDLFATVPVGRGDRNRFSEDHPPPAKPKPVDVPAEEPDQQINLAMWGGGQVSEDKSRVQIARALDMIDSTPWEDVIAEARGLREDWLTAEKTRAEIAEAFGLPESAPWQDVVHAAHGSKGLVAMLRTHLAEKSVIALGRRNALVEIAKIAIAKTDEAE